MDINSPQNNQGQKPSRTHPAHFDLLKLIVVGLVFGIIFGLVGYKLGLTHQKKPEQTMTSSSRPVKKENSVPSPAPRVQDIRTLLTSLSRSISLNKTPQESPDIDWINDANEIIPLKGLSLLYNQYNEVDNNNQPLNEKAVNVFFLRQGFTKSPIEQLPPNSNSSAYEQNDIKCTVSSSNVFCGTVDLTEVVWRSELAPLINPKNDPHIIWGVDTLDGNYAEGISGDGIAGYHWLAMKTNGQWKFIVTGLQNILGCSKVKEYNIPKDVYGTCEPGY